MTAMVAVETQHDRKVLRNLFELYLYDFSTVEAHTAARKMMLRVLDSATA